MVPLRVINIVIYNIVMGIKPTIFENDKLAPLIGLYLRINIHHLISNHEMLDVCRHFLHSCYDVQEIL